MSAGRRPTWVIGGALLAGIIASGCWRKAPEPAITVTEPNGGECWLSAATDTVRWSTTGSVGNVMIELSPDAGESWATLVPRTRMIVWGGVGTNGGVYTP